MSTQIMSDYLEGKIIDYVLRSGTFASPASVYLALFTATPSDAGGGTEVSGGSYTRKQLTGAFDAAASRTTSNTSVITFPTATAVWGLVTSVGIFDQSSEETSCSMAHSVHLCKLIREIPSRLQQVHWIFR